MVKCVVTFIKMPKKVLPYSLLTHHRPARTLDPKKYRRSLCDIDNGRGGMIENIPRKEWSV